MIKDMIEFIISNGSWGVVSICVIIISLLIYVIFKLIKNVKKIDDMSIKINNIDMFISEIKSMMNDVENKSIENSVIQQKIVKSLDDVINRIIDITVEFKSFIKNI